MKLKIINKLKKKIHKDIALLQDLVIEIVYEVFPDAIFHGGTAIWRCYGGTRFSEDIDIYLDKGELTKIDLFKEKIKQRKLNITKFKITDNVIYAKLVFNNIEMRFEASFLKIKNKAVIIKPYETIEGNYLNIFTFNADDLIEEKVNTYLSRFLVRDIYDIYVLLNYIEDDDKVRSYLKKLLSDYKKPKDEEILRSLVFIGAIPDVDQILTAIRKWAR
jgi:predicted nucleotidyltransferase component of viral defense system